MKNAAVKNSHTVAGSDVLTLLDFCKGFAMLWIVMVHALHGWFGWQGVHVFIVLGGFTLTYSCLKKENIAWREWYARRAARILPSYWLTAIAGFLLVLALGVIAPSDNQPFDFARQVWTLFTDLTFLRNFSYRTMLADPNSALWFIGLTISFYLVFPLLYSFLRKRSGDQRAILLFVCFLTLGEFVYRAVAIYFLDGDPVAYGHGSLAALVGHPAQPLQNVAKDFPFQLWAPFGLAVSRIGEYALGMAAALWLAQGGRDFERLLLHPFTFFASFAVWLGGNALLYAGLWGWIFADWVIAAGLAVWMLNLAYIARRAIPPLFRQLTKLGVWSYYLFLTHLLVGYTTARLYMLWMGSPGRVLVMILCAAASLCTACWVLRQVDRSQLSNAMIGKSRALSSQTIKPTA